MSEAVVIDRSQVPDPYAIPLDQFDLSNGHIFQQNRHWGFFERLRREDPVHLTKDSPFGPFWNIASSHLLFAGLLLIAILAAMRADFGRTRKVSAPSAA